MPAPDVTPTLARTLSFWLVTFYGLGTTLGAGIYVLIGAVAAQAGVWTPFAFLLAAAIASVTALSYAELVRRLPLCAGEASYVEAAFGRPALTRAVGLAVVVAGIASAATIVSGVTAYIAVFVALRACRAATVVLGLTAIAAYGMALSAWVASALTMAAIAGLVFVVAVGADAWQGASLAVALTPPRDLPALGGIVAGAFLAFYAFLGFEDMINVAEETRAADRVLPRAILTALVVATLLYLAVALTVVTALPADVRDRGGAGWPAGRGARLTRASSPRRMSRSSTAHWCRS